MKAYIYRSENKLIHLVLAIVGREGSEHILVYFREKFMWYPLCKMLASKKINPAPVRHQTLLRNPQPITLLTDIPAHNWEELL